MPCIPLPHPLLGAHVEGQWESLFVLEMNESLAMNFTVSAHFHMSWAFSRLPSALLVRVCVLYVTGNALMTIRNISFGIFTDIPSDPIWSTAWKIINSSLWSIRDYMSLLCCFGPQPAHSCRHPHVPLQGSVLLGSPARKLLLHLKAKLFHLSMAL